MYSGGGSSIRYGMSGVYVAAASRAHGATPNHNLTVCMLEPLPAYIPARMVHGRVAQLVCSHRFRNADCPVCILEPPIAYSGRRQTATLPCVCWSPLPRTRRTERYTVVLFSLCATSDFITRSVQCVCWSLLPHTRGNARPQPYRVYAGAASRVHAGQNSHRGVVSVFT